MQVAKWGNSLAGRLPVDIVRKLGLREGDQIDLHAGADCLTVVRHRRPEEVLAGLDRFRGRLPVSQRLCRDAANER